MNKLGVSITRISFRTLFSFMYSPTNRFFQIPDPLISFLNTSNPRILITVSLNVTRILTLSSKTSLVAIRDIVRNDPKRDTLLTNLTSSRKSCVTLPTNGPNAPDDPPLLYKRETVNEKINRWLVIEQQSKNSCLNNGNRKSIN